MGIGLPMGPLALLDLIGLDTSLSILQVLHGEYGGSRYAPAPLLRRLADAGRTGRKSGCGFYGYGSKPAAPSASPAIIQNATDAPAPATITLIDSGADSPAALAAGTELASMIAAAGIDVTRDPARPCDLAVVAANPSASVLAAALAAGQREDAVGLRLAGQLGLHLVRCPDRPGFLVGALLYPHLGDAVRMVQDGYATAADIDAAMTLGCGYPRGPMQILDDAGAAVAVSVLTAMHARYGDPAFAPPPLLAEHAAAELRFRA